ncbi:MAG TPA: alkaline phosphatase [Saprospiraceae bacterium]|nr:alkaline phosphatase [Saprospiraceae bacterium]HMP13040.1 alkaline phosphatase [Saprospiraceae bacterium]
MRHLRFFAFALLLLAACKPISTNVELNTDNTPKLAHHAENVILLIGDGMGVTQISAALFSNDNRLNLEAFPVVGLHKSYAADDLITDSAAGATAFASGVKTYNAAIGVNKDTLPVTTILEEAKSRGYAVGLVATSSITHATPASFIAHVKSRDMMEAIALDFLKTDIDIFIGGGKKYFDRREKDERDLIAELKNKGYLINDYTQSELKQITPNPAKPFGYFSADGEPLPWSKGRDYLVPATNLALNFLEQRSKKGFFLMIEGSQIDWGGHANDSKYIIEETLDFDRAIGVVLEFAKRNGKTLVIVTADHETGGYAINQGSKMGDIVPGFTTDKHTAALIPVFAYGPGAELFSGVYENTAIYNKMRLALGFK